jgi:REP element-mobilizing transposase RayT
MAGRKSLPHDIPLWVDPAQEIWFITLACQPRGGNQLALPEIWPFLVESVERRNAANVWWVHLFVAMPDHCHALVSFPTTNMKKVISDWKRWVARQKGVRWQTDFFEHRLRRDESFEEKANYVLENPVRGGLVEKAEDWPYLWRSKDSTPFTGLHR